MAEEGKPDAQLFQLLSNLLLEVIFTFSILVFWIWRSILIILFLILIFNHVVNCYSEICIWIILTVFVLQLCCYGFMIKFSFFLTLIVNCYFPIIDASFVWNWKYTVITILVRDMWVLFRLQTYLNLLGTRKVYNKIEQ